MLAMMPLGVASVLAPAERDRLGAQGASLPLADTVAYALGELDPFDAG
jgi:hypothetical protein